MIITLLSKIFGFGRDITLSYFYGASNISDAYLISRTIPTVLFGFIGTSLITAYIPMLSKIELSSSKEAGHKYTSNLINILVVIIGLIFILVFTFAEGLVNIFASGFQGDTLNIAVSFTRISLMGMFFTVLVSIFSGYLQIKDNFITPAAMGLPLNGIIIVSIIASSKGNIFILPLGTLMAIAIQFIILMISAKRQGYKHHLIFDFKDSRLKETLFIAIPVIIGVSVNQINILVDRTIASTISVGGISALNYASRLNEFIQALFVMSIITVIYPSLSKMITSNNIEGLKQTIKESISIIMIFVLPITVGSMIFANEFIEILFGRGAFDVQALNMTTSALFFYSMGMLGFGLREILSRGFYALQDTKTPMKNAAIGMALNIFLNIVLSRYLGIGGLALATSISATFTTFLLFINLRRKIGAFGMKQIVTSFMKIFIASISMGIIARFSFTYLITKLGQTTSLITAICIGATAYFIIILFLRIEDVDTFVKIIKKKLNK